MKNLVEKTLLGQYKSENYSAADDQSYVSYFSIDEQY
jgi:hypothetical protein